MKSEVYFTATGSDFFGDSILDRLEKLFNRSGAGSVINENDLVAVKSHFGEPGNVTFMSPVFYRVILEQVKKCGGTPYLTDTNTLYAGERNNAVKHIKAAYKNGFSFATVNAPVIIADGLLGTDHIEVECAGKHVKKARIASAVYQADSLIAVSHAKMHMAASYGGTLKNLGMGCASRGGKQEQHSESTPNIIENECTGCSRCVEWCNEKAIRVINKKAEIDEEKCVGCGECIAACRAGALETKWDESAELLQEKMVEYAAAAVENKKGKVFFFNFVMNVTPDCDCVPGSGKYIIPDFGILASFDPVAIDSAAADIIMKSAAIKENTEKIKKYDLSHSGKNNFKMVNPGLDHEVQLKYAEEIGLGSREYELIEVK